MGLGASKVWKKKVWRTAVAVPCFAFACPISPHIHSHKLAQLPYFAQDDDGMQVTPPALVASALASS